MLFKLQKRTLLISQLIGYAITLFVGIMIILLISQIYFDIKPILSNQTDIFKNNVAVISKNISLFKTIDKGKIYFTKDEIGELKKQTFVKNVSRINTATFGVMAISSDQTNKDIPVFKTDLFFESIPTKYLDIDTELWDWQPSSDLIPIIIPKAFLNLYNFGFAESQGLPVLSENTIGQWQFIVKIYGNGKSKFFKSKIIGLTNKFNSILVPQKFIKWANKKYGSSAQNKTSRILVEFNKNTDKTILQYFNENNYTINKEKLEFTKLMYFFKMALFAVSIIAIIIISLSVAFIFLSLNLIIQKNKEMLQNLYCIGYCHMQIARIYQITISGITAIVLLLATIASNIFRNIYIEKINKFFEITTNNNIIYTFAIALAITLLAVYNLFIVESIKKTVVPAQNK